MEIKTHQVNNIQIAEVISGDVVITSAEDGLDLLGTIYFEGFDRLILHKDDVTPEFFDLKNGMAGEILQKFSNYRVRLAVVGDFSGLSGKSINDFIYESNNGRQINFVASLAEALTRLSEG